jgi:hypothetical protein
MPYVRMFQSGILSYRIAYQQSRMDVSRVRFVNPLRCTELPAFSDVTLVDFKKPSSLACFSRDETAHCVFCAVLNIF